VGTLKGIENLVREGRFGEALQALMRSRGKSREQPAVDVMHAHLLERTGNYGHSRALCEQLLKNQALSKTLKSICHITLGVIKNDLADPDGATAHFQKAVSLAQTGEDLERTCWSQLRLMLALADRGGPHSALSLLAQARANAQKLGDPQVSAALHIFLGEMEAKRGLGQNARRHVTLGQRLLGDAPNYWLEARAENILVAIAIMQADALDGIEHARRALVLAEKSGSGGLRRACLGNLGNLHYLLGEFEEAVEHYKLADSSLFCAGDLSNACLDSLARVRLRQGNLSEAAAYLSAIEESIKNPTDWLLHANRYAQLTNAELLERQGLIQGALDACDAALVLATRAGDHLLRATAMLFKAQISSRAGLWRESVAILREVDGNVLRLSPEMDAQYQAAVACSLVATGEVEQAAQHFERARRILVGLQNVPGLLDLDRIWKEKAPEPESGRQEGEPVPTPARPTAGSVLQNVAALMTHAGRPELLATGLVAILDDSDSVLSATARARANDGSIAILASFSRPGNGADTAGVGERIVAVGSTLHRSLEVVLTPREDIESIATVNAIMLLLHTVRDLERARAEREEMQTLWPTEEIAVADDQAIVAGQMRELMTFARKVASTNVGVLITGESGTGKEILARAIHRFSPRADKPFVPFNCAAIPREMLESQLFGHRRGAFTSADRDSLGLIRAAKDGTLFLDEVGELDLDLQPKLLRFLESGEINPLGESAPFSVDVRVIAATNSNLEILVQEGRFREDLFYRLNVIRLAIPPLRERRDEIPALVHHFAARAASEFKKGRVRVAEETMEHLLLYPWPGNIRQLNNELRRMVALADADSVLKPSALPAQILRATPRSARATPGPEMAVPLRDKLTPTLWKIEREMIRVALTTHKGKVDEAARSLGISRKGLYLKRQRLGV